MPLIKPCLSKHFLEILVCQINLPPPHFMFASDITVYTCVVCVLYACIVCVSFVHICCVSVVCVGCIGIVYVMCVCRFVCDVLLLCVLYIVCIG